MSPRRLLAAAALTVLTAVGVVTVPPAGAQTPNVATPGVFHGYGFDQCNAPSQQAMNAWLRASPYLAAGIYISGNSRACKAQPNLTPTWVSTQLRKGWKLLPITLGPQASCNTRFPRYGADRRISDAPGSKGRFTEARKQGRAEATKTVAAARALGLTTGSTMWYDLEAFNPGQYSCRYSALAFLSAWTARLHELHYLSGVYSSASSGIWVLDQARMKTPNAYHLPDQIWIARWDGLANTSTTYIGNAGWQGGRMKQYLGGHNERYGGVTINVDRDYVSLGTLKVHTVTHCGGVKVDFPDYPRVTSSSSPTLIKAVQCLLSEQKAYAGHLTGTLNQRTVTAIKAWQKAHGLRVMSEWSRKSWMTLVSTGDQPIVKFGSTGPAVRDLQRALNAATPGTDLPITGIFSTLTNAALATYQRDLGRYVSAVANPSTWAALQSGLRP
jgi:hypothetical protein